MFDDAQSLYFGLVPSLVQLYLETMQHQHIIIHGHGLMMTMSQNWKSGITLNNHIGPLSTFAATNRSYKAKHKAED